jgi:hypothetical protein
MYASIIAILFVLVVGYIWSSRGFFSSLLNLAVTIVSGAIAFAAWEPLAHALVTGVDASSRLVHDVVWGASLLLPFAISMVVLTLVVNQVVKSNLRLLPMADWAGGAVCGLLAGVIVSGIAMLGVSMTRTSTDFLGNAQLEYDAQGSVVDKSGLIMPTDRWVAGFYGYTSERVFASSKPLAVIRPHVAVEGHLLRLAEPETLPRYSLQPKDVSLAGRYTVGQNQNVPLNQLVGDNKSVLALSGEKIADPAYVEGFVVNFGPGAKEGSGQVVMGAGMATLVLRSPNDDQSITLQPMAIVSQAKGDNLDIGRWRLDGRNVFIGSVGGASEATFAFEFLVPKVGDGGWQPLALYVRGVRIDLTDKEGKVMAAGKTFGMSVERDGAIESRTLFTGLGAAAGGPLEGTGTILKEGFAGLNISQSLPARLVIDSGQVTDVEFDKDNRIKLAEKLLLKPSQMETQGVDRSLRVDSFFPGDGGTSIVTLDVGRESPFSILQPLASEASGAPSLVDTSGQRFQAIGFVYRDRTGAELRFTPGKTLSSIFDGVPSLSRNREDQSLFLVFRVSSGVKLKHFAVGNTAIATIEKPIEVQAQNSR